MPKRPNQQNNTKAVVKKTKKATWLTPLEGILASIEDIAVRIEEVRDMLDEEINGGDTEEEEEEPAQSVGQ